MSSAVAFSWGEMVSLESLVASGEVKLGRGNVISKIDIQNNPGPYPIYSSSSKNDGKMGEYGDYMFDEEMISWSVDGGGYFFHRPKHKFSVTNVSGYMRLNSDWDYKFTAYSFQFQHGYFSFDYQTKAHPSVIREFYFLPKIPVAEQQKIATILSSVDDVIEKTRAQIDKLKDLKTGMMQELLTKGIGHTEFKSSDVGQIPKSWACELVSSLFEIQLGKMLSQAAKIGASPMPYLGNKDVQWGKINVTDLQTMDFSEREREKFLLKPRDLLMCEGGEVGRSAIWEGELKECYYQKAIHRLRPIDDAYEPRLLLEYMRYAKGQNLLADFISQTSIAHLTREKLSAIPIPVPPVAEQKKIVDIITSIDTRINRHLDKLKNTYDIKKALMQDLLTGKVRVNLNESAAL